MWTAAARWPSRSLRSRAAARARTSCPHSTTAGTTPRTGVAHVGSRVFKRSGGWVDNFPDQQKTNGIAKDGNTGGRYKRYVRALKNAENFLADQGVIGELPSYFMECLVWNVPNSEITLGGTLDRGFRNTLAYLFNNLRTAAS